MSLFCRKLNSTEQNWTDSSKINAYLCCIEYIISMVVAVAVVVLVKEWMFICIPLHCNGWRKKTVASKTNLLRATTTTTKSSPTTTKCVIAYQVGFYCIANTWICAQRIFLFSFSHLLQPWTVFLSVITTNRIVMVIY